MIELDYHKEGDYLIPNIQPEPLVNELRIWDERYIENLRKTSIGKLGRCKMNGTLLPITIEVQKSAKEMEKQETARLMKEYEVTPI